AREPPGDAPGTAVPFDDVRRTTRRRQATAVGAEGELERPVVAESLEGRRGRHLDHRPDSDSTVQAARSDLIAVGTDGNLVDLIVVAVQREEGPAVVGAPDPPRPVAARGDQPLAVGAEGHAAGDRRPLQGKAFLAVVGVPDAHYPVASRRGEPV